MAARGGGGDWGESCQIPGFAVSGSHIGQLTKRANVAERELPRKTCHQEQGKARRGRQGEARQGKALARRLTFLDSGIDPGQSEWRVEEMGIAAAIANLPSGHLLPLDTEQGPLLNRRSGTYYHSSIKQILYVGNLRNKPLRDEGQVATTLLIMFNSSVAASSSSSVAMNPLSPFGHAMSHHMSVKLDSDNYLLWRSLILLVIRGNQFDGILFGT
ncbi:hypothetical protein Sjap_020646 [Stephania japonica]|uniref:Retrotransposon Copia-like N-terminal domain-containing protein n=1 Tax=Stephania japonica TaxID=461633 RepID=A0AAP0HZ66_9MAGN